MKVFLCDHCRHLVFFENTHCVRCGHLLAFLPDLGVIGSLDSKDGVVFTSPLPRTLARTYRLCANYNERNVCNWSVPADSPESLCLSCRLTSIIPDLDRPGHLEKWYKLEVAKRRLIYTLLALGLPMTSREEDPDYGLAFEFRADPDPMTPDSEPVMTGHANGLITVNIAEADDAERERRRIELNEPYRTLLGHFRHEIAHYYWNYLIARAGRLESFRALFGDEQVDYGEALQRHYSAGPPVDWNQNFISSYATMHAWEDWAETFAHYLHMVDTLETAADCGLSINPRRPQKPTLSEVPDPLEPEGESFDVLIERWFPLTYVLNNLNRGLGLPDGYPFILSPAVIEKLRYVHETIAAAVQTKTGGGDSAPPPADVPTQQPVA